MLNDRFAQLMAKQLSGEALPEEQIELQDLLKQDPEAGYFFSMFSEYWNIEPRKTDDSIQEEIHFQQILAIAEKGKTEEAYPVAALTEPEPAPARRFSFAKLAVAAAFIGLIVVCYKLIQTQPPPQPEKLVAVNEIEAKKGARSYMLLPDGTQVWLNSDSKIEYKGNFNDSIREVTLTGEAYFDVVKDRKRPFIVHTSDIDIRVLGTAFNVKSYPREPSIEATLIHGLIEVTNKKEPTSPKVILHPHEKIVYMKDMSKPAVAETQTMRVKPFTVAALPKNIADTSLVETSWVYNKLIFDGETFDDIALKMERWYNVKITFRNDKVARIPIHYTIENETVEEALKAMQYIEDFTYKKTANEIEIF